MWASSSKMFNIIALPFKYSGTGENPPHYQTASPQHKETNK